MCRVHHGDGRAFEALLEAVMPQWAPYLRWGRSSGTTADLQQELRLTLWETLQRHLPTVLQPVCHQERGDD